MGCNTSAPSYVDSYTQHAHATEDLEAMEDKVEEHSEPMKVFVNNVNKEMEAENGDIVLPTRDTVVEPLDLVRNHLQETKPSAVEDIACADVPISSENKINEQTVIDVLLTEKKEAEERRQKELDFLEELSKMTEIESATAVEEETVKNENVEIIQLPDVVESKELELEGSETEDAVSESSRTTRWEALADVVAELPPSLTIDPVTGQIYTTK